MNKKMRKLFVGLTVLFILALVLGTLAQPRPVLAGGGIVDCTQDGLTDNFVVSGTMIRDLFWASQVPFHGPGSTLVITSDNGGNPYIIIWVVLYHTPSTDEYGVRTFSVVTGCNG